MNNQPVWFVTGASKGLGLNMVKQLLEQGFRVAATSRNLNDLRRAVATQTDAFLPLAVDLTTEASVQEAIQTTINQFGRIDVVVNNAGYGLLGSLEELTDAEARANFNVNVFGSLNVIRNVLPLLRKQRSGHVINLSSIGGFTGMFPGFGIYCATKFAIEGFTEALATEVKTFGISVTIVSPGYFRTDFLTSGSLSVAEKQMDDYEAVRQAQQAHQTQYNGNQPGDPDKAVAAIIRVASESNPPLHLFLGQDAYNLAYEKIKAVQHDLETWKIVTVSTNFDVAEIGANA